MRPLLRLLAIGVVWALLAAGASAATRFIFDAPGVSNDLRDQLKTASLTWGMRNDSKAKVQDLLGAANADYRNLVEALYALGYYGGTVSIKLDGTEAANVDVFAVPKSIGRIAITVTPGKLFRFGALTLGPVPPGMPADPAFARGKPALSTVISDRAQAVVAAWQAAAHPLAKIGSQSVVADHATHRLAVTVKIDPGPAATFGSLVIKGDTKVRTSKIEQIAGLRSGDPYSTDALDTVAARLKRVPAFGSVVLTPADHLNPDGSIDIVATITDRARHRFGFGIEYDTEQGLTLSGFWLDRNLLGRAESLRIDAKVSNLDTTSSGTDYSFGVRVEDPARRRVDTVSFYTVKYEYLDEPTFLSESTSLGFGYSRIFSKTATGQIEWDISKSTATDDLGTRRFTILSMPITATQDLRDDKLDPGKGIYLAGGLTPFTDIENQVTGLRSTLDARTYHRFDTKLPLTLAGRVQVGSLTGARIRDVQPDMLFYSGGGGTVRGQPYQSLGVDLGGGIVTGGRSFLGASVELRARKGDYGAALFADTGYVGEETFPNGHGGAWQSGAGIGFRYFTSLGPFRADLAWPVAGGTGKGVQLYIGIGQAF